MVSYKITYTVNGVENNVTTDSSKDIKFAIRKRVELGSDLILALVYRHNVDEIHDNNLIQISDQIYNTNITNFAVSMINDGEETIIFSTPKNKVELDVEPIDEQMEDVNTTLPYVTTLRIG